MFYEATESKRENTDYSLHLVIIFFVLDSHIHTALTLVIYVPSGIGYSAHVFKSIH